LDFSIEFASEFSWTDFEQTMREPPKFVDKFHSTDSEISIWITGDLDRPFCWAATESAPFVQEIGATAWSPVSRNPAPTPVGGTC
jgi:hypothetical protein